MAASEFELWSNELNEFNIYDKFVINNPFKFIVSVASKGVAYICELKQ